MGVTIGYYRDIIGFRDPFYFLGVWDSLNI